MYLLGSMYRLSADAVVPAEQRPNLEKSARNRENDGADDRAQDKVRAAWQ
jgi:hypothetical protein